MRRGSLGTLFLTVFLDLVGFGLIIPFLPALARDFGASDFTAAALAASYSLMQFLAVPLWGRASDRLGRRPILIWSIAASSVGMIFLGLAQSLPLVFLARLWSGAATANIAVAQAYIADVTSPKERARGMGLLGMGFGLGFMLGPFIGGELGRFHVVGHQGTLPAFFSAALSVVNLLFALRYLPESLPASARAAGRSGPAAVGDGDPATVPVSDAGALVRKPGLLGFAAWGNIPRGTGIRATLLVTFTSIFWYTGVQAIFRLFTLDAFGMTIENTGRVLGLMGLTAVIVQGGLIGKLNRRFGEVNLLSASVILMSVGFVLDGMSVSLGVPMFLVATVITSLGTALHMPSVSSYISRRATADRQGAMLGVMQSAGALARAIGPLLWGLLYDGFGLRAPFYIAAVAVGLLLVVVPRLPRPA